MKNIRKTFISFGLIITIYWNIIKDTIKPFLNFKFLLSFFLAWMITNGWSYVFLIVGTIFKIKWMLTIGASYQAFLWMPWTPEKLVTIPLAIFFHKVLFPKDFKNIDKLNKMLKKEKKNNK